MGRHDSACLARRRVTDRPSRSRHRMPRSPDADPVGPTCGNGRATEKLRDRSPSGVQPTRSDWRSHQAGPRPSAPRRANREPQSRPRPNVLLIAGGIAAETQRAAHRAKRKPSRCPRGRRAGDLVPMRGVASDARRATPAARPSGRVPGVRGDAYCLPEQQRSFGWRRIAAAAQIRPREQRVAARGARRRLLASSESSRLGSRACSSGHEYGVRRLLSGPRAY
jgi:hypothetical protein